MSELEQWETRFAAPGYLFGTEPNAFVKSKASLLRAKAPGQALSIADGEGRNGVFMAEQGLDVLAIDFSPKALEKSRQLAKQRGVSLRIEQADLETWKFPVAAFDVVVGIFFQFTPPDLRRRVFADIKRSLKPKGLLLIEGYTPKQLQYNTGGPPQVEQLYTRKVLEGAFGDMSSLDIQEYEAELSEGDRHKGMSALIDLVAIK